jgi:hypothetical protein
MNFFFGLAAFLLVPLVSGTDFINRMALIKFNSPYFETLFTPCEPVSIYTAMYDSDQERTDLNFTSTGRSRLGRITKSLAVYHPFGNRLAFGDEWYVDYPARFNTYGWYNARIELPVGYNYDLKLVVDNDGAVEDGVVVIVQNDDYGNTKEAAYPFLLGTDAQEFREVYAFLDYGGDEDYFLVGIYDPENKHQGKPQLINFWSENARLGGGKTTDVYAYLYDKDGNQLAYHDDIVLGSLQNFDFWYSLVPNEIYFMRIKGWAQNTVGSYVFRYSRIARTATESLLLTSFTTFSATMNVTVNNTVYETVSLTSSSVPWPEPTNSTNSTGVVSDTYGAVIYDQVTFSCGGSCPTMTGVATVQQFCIPHVACSVAHRPQYNYNCTDSCYADFTNVTISQIVCPTPPPPPPPGKHFA